MRVWLLLPVTRGLKCVLNPLVSLALQSGDKLPTFSRSDFPFQRLHTAIMPCYLVLTVSRPVDFRIVEDDEPTVSCRGQQRSSRGGRCL